jgi:imidazolonepropionase-like amidohydrolase
VGNPYLVPGFSLHENLELMVTEAGFSPAEALRTATINPARFLNMETASGSVQGGKLADLVLLDRNPLIDIRNTTSIVAVIQNGRYLDRGALNALLLDAEKAALAFKKPIS